LAQHSPERGDPSEYLPSLYFDTVALSATSIALLTQVAGADHVLLGTDYPFPWNTAPVDHILSIPGLTDADRIKILGATAAKLLGIAD
jgi:aminocarboxymuconate-semialdehyde decarboxylase